MLTFADLQENPDRVAELGGFAVLIAAFGSGEEVLRQQKAGREATMVFAHETIKMMQAERTEQLDKLRDAIEVSAPLVLLRKAEESLWDHVTVGRASTADVFIDDPAISNVHAHFEVDGEEVSLHDDGSSNGTHVNRVQLQPNVPQELKGGDCVRFGQTIFYFVGNSMLSELLGISTGPDLSDLLSL